MKLMFDTNIFNNILENNIDIKTFHNSATFYATNIQLDEINKTSDKYIDKRNDLNNLFHKLVDKDKKIPTETFIADVSHTDLDKVGSGTLFKIIEGNLDMMNKKKKGKNTNDALIAEASITNDFILITNDSELLKVTQKLNGKAINLDNFIASYAISIS